MLEAMRIFVLTPAKFAEIHGKGGAWSELMHGNSIWGVIVDEHQRCTWKMAAVMPVGCSFTMFAGDVPQERDARGAHTARADVQGDIAIGRAGLSDDPLREPWGMLPHWLPQVADIQRSPLNESFRLGPTCVSMLQRMFPQRHQEMESARGQRGGTDDTLCLLTLLSRLDDWTHDEHSCEALWSPTFAAHVGMLVATELVCVLNDPVHTDQRGVLVISFWKGFLHQLEQFLSLELEGLCARVHEHFRIPRDGAGTPIYSYAALRSQGVLSISTTLAAGGADAWVGILCLPHRRSYDWGWQGDPTQRHLQLIACSRASSRLHAIAEDLRSEIVLPDGDSPGCEKAWY